MPFTARNRVAIGWIWIPLFCLFVFRSRAQEASDTNALTLLPPYGELPPTFWERYGGIILASSLFAALVLAIAIWLLFRQKQRIVPSPAKQARQSLERLRGQPESGACLSEVSQIVRRYFVGAFNLRVGEPTTEEFRSAISTQAMIRADLAAAVVQFLRECDERKFSPAHSQSPVRAVERAMEFIERAEAARNPPPQAATK